MIKGNIFICALASIVLAWGCDKIEANENGLYEEYAGSAITWSEGTSITTNAGKRVFLEKYTGPKCPNCPTADDSIHSAQRQFGNRLVVVAIHDYSSFGRPLGEIDLRTEKGDNWSSYFGVRNAGSYPSAIINRMHNDNTFDLFMPTTVLSDKIANALTSALSINMEVTSTLTANTTTIDVNIEFLISKHSDKDLNSPKRKMFVRNLLITILLCVALFLIATVIFIYPVVKNAENAEKYWVAFVAATPLCALTVDFYGCKENYWLVRLISISLFVWLVITTVYCISIVLGIYSLWMLYLVGVPIQAAICLLFFWKKTF